LKAKRVVPKGTAFEPRLYDFESKPTDQMQSIEREFMSPLDSSASHALNLLETNVAEGAWSNDVRDGWSRFLLAQMLRTPEDIEQLKTSVRQDWESSEPELEAKYAAKKRIGDPETIKEYLQSHEPDHLEKLTASIAKRLMTHTDICNVISNMYWQVLEIPNDTSPLLTSDRPVWMTTTITEANAFFILPIGPKRLFTASVTRGTRDQLKKRHRIQLGKYVNKLVVQHAVNYVYGVDDKLLVFVQKHIATRRHSSLLERIASYRDFKIVSPDSPLSKGK
jgi:Protein of unknown function (DUF4238)